MSLRLQLLGAFAYVLLLVIVALEVPLALNLRAADRRRGQDEAAAQAFVVAASASGQIQQPQRSWRWSPPGRQRPRRPRDRRRRAAGRLLADSPSASPAAAVRDAARPELAHRAARVRAQGERHSDTLGQDLLYTAVPVTNNGHVVGAVRVTQDLAAVTTGSAAPCSR